jgi:hypothetical protein
VTRPIPDPEHAGDDGAPDAALTSALAALAAGTGTGGDLLVALSTARLLVPVVAVLEEAETGQDGLRRDKQSAMSSVTVQRPDGTRSLIAFTSVDALRSWRSDARPIAASARRVAQATLAEGAAALVVDPAGPVSFAVTGAELRALALASDPTAAPHEDASVAAAVSAICAGEPAVLSAFLEAAEPSGLRLLLVVDDALPLDEFRELAPRLRNALSADTLLRARVETLQLAIVPPSQAPSRSDRARRAYRRA